MTRAILVIVSGLAGAALASIPLSTTAAWVSSDNDYSTGGAFVDIDGNGWIDLCTSNGNDMAENQNGIYFNSGGNLDTIAAWRSAESGYFGHCYVGDVNNDGLPDLAVAYLGGASGGELCARLYLNTGTGLVQSPSWRADDLHRSFDCCLGDVDLDGRLDLAISAGDAYDSANGCDRARIYRNNGTTFDTLPFWIAADTNPSDAIRFCDVDNDGDLDLFVGQTFPGGDSGKVSMYRNNNGVLETTPSWTARAGVGWVLRLAFGDYDDDGFLDLAVASNAQEGAPNSLKVFHNNGGTLDTVAAFTMLRGNRYSSCVAWADVNNDGFLDLAAGGWWEPLVVFENHAGVLDTTPTWSWAPPNPGDLVCETALWGDVRNAHLVPVTDGFSGDGTRKLFTTHHRPLQFLDSVVVNGTRVPGAGFCFDLLGGWVSFANAPPAGSDNVLVCYRYSEYPDLAVTNWTSDRGNYLLLNTTPGAVAEGSAAQGRSRSSLAARPNPFARATTLLTARTGTAAAVRITDASGREVRVLRPGPSSTVVPWDGCDGRGNPAPAGVYFARLETNAGPTLCATKLVKLAGD